MKFYEEHAADRGRFEILAFHDDQAKTFADLDPKLADLKEKAWAGKELPFPILLDSSGKTIRDFDIHAFPTTILVDTEGNLVKDGGEGMLAVKLGEGRPASIERARALAALAGKRKEALALMTAMGPADGEDGVFALSLFLRDCKDPECAEAALDAFDRIGGEAAMGRLFALGLASEDGRRQVRAAVILGRRLPSDRLDGLFRTLQRPGVGLPLAQAICDALAARSAELPDISKALLGATQSLNPAVRTAAAAAIVECKAEGARERLEAMLAVDGSEPVRTAAARCLGRLGDPAAADALRTAVSKDRSFVVRGAAAEALAALGTK
jgi:HEAT repeat protein